MAPRTIYANLADGLQPLGLFDQSLADMGSLGVIPCTATGMNAIALTPISSANAPNPTYNAYNQFSFVATSTSTSTITINVNGLGPLSLFKSNGSLAGAGDITANNFYEIAYSAALNSSAGGFYLFTSSSVGNSEVLWGSSFGVVGNGVADDTAAMQNLINAAVSLGVPARFTGNCKITSSLTIGGAIDFGGVTYLNSVLIPSTGINCMTVNTVNSVSLHDFAINYPSAANTNIVGLTVTATTQNIGSRIWNFSVSQAYFGINFARASGFTLTNSQINQFVSTGIIVANANVVDSGDSVISGCLIVGSPTVSANAVSYQSSGGLKFFGNKINGTSLNSGFLLQLASGAVTSNLMITGNSIEGPTSSGSAIEFVRSGATGNFSSVAIAGNRLFGGTCVNVPTDANGAWLSNLSITGNACTLPGSATDVCFSIDSTTGVAIDGNSIVSNNASSKQFVIGTATTHCGIGVNVGTGTFASSTFSSGSCDSISPQTVGTASTVLHGSPTSLPTYSQVAISTDVGGLGTGIATALGVNVGTAGAPVINGGALGSPSSAGTLPALTLGGTVSGGGQQVNNVLIGASNPQPGKFTTLNASVDEAFNSSGQVIAQGATNTNKQVWFGFDTTLNIGFLQAIFQGTGFVDAAMQPNGGNLIVGGTTTSSAQLDVQGTGTGRFRGTTASTSPTTGALLSGGGVGAAGAIYAGAEIKSTSASSGVGYAVGSGGSVTQATSRTTGVTLNNVTGAITMFSAAGSATAASFTVTNSAVAATDVIHLSQKSGTNLYNLLVTAVAAGSFQITFFTTGGVATDAPVINFAIIKGSAT